MLTLSRLDLFEIGRQYVLTRANRINPQLIDTAGSDVNIVVGSSAYMAAAVSSQVSENAANLFLESCEGEALDRFAFDRYQQVRLGAAAALGTVQFSRASFAAGAGSVPVGSRLVSLTGIEYTTITPATFGATDLFASADVRAAQAGKNFQVGKNVIRGFSDIQQIFDPIMQVTNPDACAGGEDVEGDDTFKSRLRDFWRAARRGTLGAIEYGARTVPGVASATAVDVIGSFGQPVRVVQLFIADSSGVASRALAAKVDQVLMDWRAGGIFVSIDLSQPQIADFLLKLVFLSGVDTVSLGTQIRSAIVEFVNSLGGGQTLLLGDLYAVLSRYKQSGLIVQVPGTIISPIGDLVPDPGHTIRTTLSNIQQAV